MGVCGGDDDDDDDEDDDDEDDEDGIVLQRWQRHPLKTLV